MYLIRGISNHIEDLEHGRTYYYDDGLPDYETGETVAKVVVTGWLDAANGNTYATELAFEDDAKRLWQHLESLLKFDADKAPQPAPAETPPVERSFKTGEAIRDRQHHQHDGIVTSIESPDEFYDEPRYWTSFNKHRPYFASELEPAD